MSTPNDTSRDIPGGQGEALFSDMGHIREDCKLVERYGAGFEPEKRAAVAMRLLSAIARADKARDIAGLVRAYAMLDRLNLDYRKDDREAKREGTDTPRPAVDHAIAEAMREAIDKDERYADYLRQLGEPG
jgi:hypothetical protein